MSAPSSRARLLNMSRMSARCTKQPRITGQSSVISGSSKSRSSARGKRNAKCCASFGPAAGCPAAMMLKPRLVISFSAGNIPRRSKARTDGMVTDRFPIFASAACCSSTVSRSSTSGRTPCSASSDASISPTGPAPTMATSQLPMTAPAWSPQPRLGPLPRSNGPTH